MGSCFAREIRTWLLSHDFNYVMKGSPEETRHGSANWERVYNTPTMHQELRRILLDEEFPIHRTSTGTWIDPYRKNIEFNDESAARKLIARYRRDAADALSEMEIFIITLGVSEVWVERSTGLTLAEFPKSHLASQMDLKFTVLEPERNISELESIIELLRNTFSNIQIVLTVSPVPLRATFANRSVVVSNSISKSSLLLAATRVASEYEKVTYFPSFEIALLESQDGPPFSPDGRHVRPQTVYRIMQAFQECYVK